MSIKNIINFLLLVGYFPVLTSVYIYQNGYIAAIYIFFLLIAVAFDKAEKAY